MTADDKDRPKLDAETKAAFRQANSAIKELIQLVLLRDVNTRFPIDKGVIFFYLYIIRHGKVKENLSIQRTIAFIAALSIQR